MMTFLKHNKDGIQSLASIIQAFAVVVGVGFAVNEFVIKDRLAKRDRLERTVDIISNPHSLAEFLDPAILTKIREQQLDSAFRREQRSTLRYSANITICRATDACDDEMLMRYVCPRAIIDSFLVFKSVVEPQIGPDGEYLVHTSARDLFDFAAECVREDHLFNSVNDDLDSRLLHMFDSLGQRMFNNDAN